MNIAIISFTHKGAELNNKLNIKLREDCIDADSYGFYKYPYKELKEFNDIGQLVGDIFNKYDAIIYISATGIAVRSIAPFLVGKDIDPAILVIDDCGQYVISLLSGHLGGANELSIKVANMIEAQSIITTATDNNNRFAVDVFAKENNLYISDLKSAKEVSARLLNNEPVGYISEFDYKDDNLKNLVPISRDMDSIPECGVVIGDNIGSLFPITCRLIPKDLVVGIGCKKGKSSIDIEVFLREVLEANNLDVNRINLIASIDKKKDEVGIKETANKLDVPFITFSSEELEQIEGDFSTSQFVMETVGVDNVCERSAILGSKSSKLLVRKQARDGITIAVARKEIKIC